MKRPSWVGGAVVCMVVFVAALMGVAWGVWHSEETSRLLQVCWTTLEDGTQIPRYVEGAEVFSYGPCEGAQELVWPKENIPLTVAAVSDLEHAEANSRLIQAAVESINRQVKFELLRFVGDGLGVDARVLVYPGEEVETEVDVGGEGWRNLPGYVVHYRDGYEPDSRKLYCDIVLGLPGLHNDISSLDFEQLLLQAVGLAHDDDPSSVMYPSEQRQGVRSGKITGRDRVLLRMLYRGPRSPG